MPHTNEEMREKLFKLWKELRLEDKTSFEEIPAVIQLENFINQEISDLKKSIREEVEKEIDVNFRLEDWSGEYEVYQEIERLKQQILSLKSLE